MTLPASTGTPAYSRSYAKRYTAAHIARATASTPMEGARKKHGSDARQKHGIQNQRETSIAAQAHSRDKAGISKGADAVIRSGHGRRTRRTSSMQGEPYGMASAPSGSRGRTEGSGRTTLAGRGALRWSTLGARASLVS